MKYRPSFGNNMVFHQNFLVKYHINWRAAKSVTATGCKS